MPISAETNAVDAATPPTESDESPEQVFQRRAALIKLFSRIGELSSLPQVAGRIVQIADNNRANVADLLSAIESDPAMAIRILRLVNSGFYGLRNRVGDLKHAVTLMGFQQVRGLALTLYVSRFFRASGDYRGYSRGGLWNHQVAVASASRLIAEVCSDVSPDEAYVAGLLHDIGYVLIDEHIRPRFKQILDAIEPDTDTLAVERKVLGFDHCLLGAFVMHEWHLPESVYRSAAYHHNPLDYDGPHGRMVCLVAMANYFCTYRGLTSLGVKNLPVLDEQIYTRLGITEARAAQIVDRLDDVLSLAANAASA